MNPVDLLKLFDIDDEEFRRRFRDTALWRARRRGLLRNAAIVLGNQRDPQAVQPLCRGITDAEPIVRGACAWALGQIGGPISRDALSRQFAIESDSIVRNEIQLALGTSAAESEP